MRHIDEDVKASLGAEPEPSGFAKIAQPWPNKETEPEKYAEAIKTSQEYSTFVLKQVAVIYGLFWAALGFVGARQGLLVVVGFSSEIRARLQTGDLTTTVIFLGTILAAGLVFFLTSKYRLLGAFEIGAALGSAFYGFAESGSPQGAIFIYLAGIIATADGFARLLRKKETAHE